VKTTTAGRKAGLARRHDDGSALLNVGLRAADERSHDDQAAEAVLQPDEQKAGRAHALRGLEQQYEHHGRSDQAKPKVDGTGHGREKRSKVVDDGGSAAVGRGVTGTRGRSCARIVWRTPIELAQLRGHEAVVKL
jgi:hypothetical protein